MRSIVAALSLVATAMLGPTQVSSAGAATTYRVLITGDSITQGSSGDYTWRYRLWNKLQATETDSVSFVGTRTDLYDNVNDTFGSYHYAADFGGKAHSARWGTSFQQQLSGIQDQVSSTNANVLVVMLGSNDLAYATSPAQTISNLKTYIARARQAKPGIDVVVGQVVNRWDPWSQAYTLTAETTEYANRLADAASALDTSSERVVVAPTRSGWDAKSHTWDGTHPNATGEALIAQRVSQALASIGIGSASPDISGSKSWNVPGSNVSLTPGSERVGLSWNRTPSGATGMFIEQRLTNTGAAWERLPYAVGGDGWTAELLAAGGTYQYRVVPSKGFATGVAGPAATTTTGGPMPADLAAVRVSAGNDSLYGGKTAQADWDPSANATAYVLASRMMSNGTANWDELPYAIDGTSWTFQPNAQGRYYQFRVKPVRGFLTPGWKSSRTTRMKGVPANRVYVALGDSYSSGLGAVALSDYKSGGCRRTPEAWPFKMQTQFQDNTAHFACAGAVRADVYNLQVGPMNDAFASNKGRPQLITMTIGGNDIGFSTIAKDCVIGSGSCLHYETPTAEAIDNLRPNLRNLYTSLKLDQPYADVVVGGYPVVVEPGEGGGFPDTCDLFGNNERAMVDRLVNRLNSSIGSAASEAGVWSAARHVQDRFEGHGACTSGEWIHGPKVSGVEAHPNSFHPNLSGQLAYAFAFSDTIIDRAGS